METLWAYITAFLKKRHLEREHMTNNLVSSSIRIKNFTLAVSYFWRSVSNSKVEPTCLLLACGIKTNKQEQN